MKLHDIGPDCFKRDDAVTVRGPIEPPPRRDEVQERVTRLGPWFHNLDLHGVQTAPGHFLGDYPGQKWRRFASALPADLTGASVLDIGCNAGFFSIAMKKRGATRVLGIDTDPRYLAQAALAAALEGVELELRRLSVYEVSRLAETFDVVLFMGVLYHLRYPLLALDLLAEHTVGDLLVVQSLLRGSDDAPLFRADYPFEEEEVFDRPGYPRLHFVEHRYAGDPTNWWIPNRACAEAMIRSAGFRIVDQPCGDVFVCRRADRVGAPLWHTGPRWPW